jgi:hypothetical protein
VPAAHSLFIFPQNRKDETANRWDIRRLFDPLEDKNPTYRLLNGKIFLSNEEEHAGDLADLLFAIDPSTGKPQ